MCWSRVCVCVFGFNLSHEMVMRVGNGVVVCVCVCVWVCVCVCECVHASESEVPHSPRFAFCSSGGCYENWWCNRYLWVTCSGDDFISFFLDCESWLGILFPALILGKGKIQNSWLFLMFLYIWACLLYRLFPLEFSWIPFKDPGMRQKNIS